MKTTEVNGTCGAFFFYRNDSQEIDVEILSSQQDYDSSNWPVNLVVQNTTAPLALNATGPSSNNMIYYMPYPPYGPAVTKYHEYRFDWLPDRIDYYIDNYRMATFTENIPSTPGAIHLSHWSNGNTHWSFGPPAEDAVMTVAYVKAYFNTTDAVRVASLPPQCGTLDSAGHNEALCQIPDQTTAPWPGGPFGNQTGKTFFFTRPEAEPTVNDTADDNAIPSAAGCIEWQGDLVKLAMLYCVAWFFGTMS